MYLVPVLPSSGLPPRSTTRRLDSLEWATLTGMGVLGFRLFRAMNSGIPYLASSEGVVADG